MIGFFAASLLAAPVVSAGEWATYTNDRFGTSVQIPESDLRALPAPQNGDGQGWVSKDMDVSLVVYGSYWGVTVESWDDYRTDMRRYMLEEKVILTYAPRGDGWFVLSGKVGDNIVYMRVSRSKRCPDIAHHLRLEYPATQKEQRDAMVARVSKSMGEVLSAACP